VSGNVSAFKDGGKLISLARRPVAADVILPDLRGVWAQIGSCRGQLGALHHHAANTFGIAHGWTVHAGDPGICRHRLNDGGTRLLPAGRLNSALIEADYSPDGSFWTQGQVRRKGFV
jgi:hypothetical protein